MATEPALPDSDGFRTVPRFAAFFTFGAVVLLTAVLAVRVFGPSDLGQNPDQARTMSYTADMVINGRWALARDSIGHLCRKPPLVNWLAAPGFAAGLYHEWAFKLPSILGGLAAFAAAWAGAARLLPRAARDLRPDAARLAATAPAALGALAGAVWLASPSAVKHIYFCRPDMLFTGLLACGWYTTIRVADAPNRTRRTLWTATAWVLTGAALLTKGPIALLIPAQLALGSLIRRDVGRPPWHAWLWGPAIAAAMFALWIVPAYRVDPAFVTDELIGSEVLSRLLIDGDGRPSGAEAPPETTPGSPLTPLIAIPRVLGWFVERFTLGALPALAAFIFVRPWRWRTHPLAPAAIWVTLVLGVTMLIPVRAGSYLIPAHPVAAILAVYALLRVRSPLPPVGVLAVAAIFAAGVAGREAIFSRAARLGTGDALWAFSREAARMVGDDEVVFVDTWVEPVPTMMGRVRTGPPTPREIASAAWVITRLEGEPPPDRPEPVLTSDRVGRVAARTLEAKDASYIMILAPGDHAATPRSP